MLWNDMQIKKRMYQKALLMSVCLTGIFSRFNVNIPTKWYSFIDTLQVSTGVLHSKLCTMDKEVQQEYRALETSFERQLGITSYYSPEEIEEIKNELDNLHVETLPRQNLY